MKLRLILKIMDTSEKLSEEIAKMPSDQRKELKIKMEETLNKMKQQESIKPSERRGGELEGNKVYLSLWDKILMFILSVFGIMTQNEYILRKRIRAIKEKIRSISPPIMNVRTNELFPQFGKYIFEVYQKFQKILELLKMTVFNPNLWDNTNLQYTTCAEHLFEFLTNTRALFGISDVKSLLAKKLPIKRVFDQIDTEVEKILSTVDPALINRANRVYSKLFVIKELEDVDFKKLLRYFTNERNAIANYCIPDVWFIRELEKLDAILSETDITPMILDVLTSLRKYLESVVDKDTSEYKSLLEIDSVISQDGINELNNAIESLHLVDVVSLLKRDPDYIPLFVVPDRSLLNIYKDVVKKKAKNYASQTIGSIVKEKQNLFYILLPEGTNTREKLVNITIYTDDKNNTFNKYQLPLFLYTVPIELIYVFYESLWKKGFYNSINELIINGIFKDKYLKTTISNLMVSVNELEKDFADFLKHTGREGEEYNIINRVFNDPSSLNSESFRKLLQQKISFVNSLAYSIIFKAGDYLSQLNKYLDYIMNDFNSITPEYVLNIKTIKGPHNLLLRTSLSRGKDVISNIMEILSYFYS